MTVYENLAFGLRMKKKDRLPKEDLDRKVRSVADTVGLSAALDRNASRLSVNDMQKVALGRSMIVEPAIFLLDEPFSNLDSAFRAYMRAELKRIQHEIGQTMVYVTHDQVEAMSMADKVAVMDLGVLQQYATPDELYNRPANRFVANFIGSVLNNFVPVTYEAGFVRPTAEGSRPVDVSDRKAAIEGRKGAGRADALGQAGADPLRCARLGRGDRHGEGRARRTARREGRHPHAPRRHRRPHGRRSGRAPPDRRQPRSRLRPGFCPHLRRRHRPRPEVDDVATIRLENITKRFGPITALDGVSFDVKDGEFFAILGPPGAGKTTTLRTIVGLEAPEEGDVFLDDERVTDAWPGDRDISIVFQNLALYPDKTVYNNLAFPLKQRKVAKDEIKRRVGETAKVLAHRAPHEAQAGQAVRRRAPARRPRPGDRARSEGVPLRRADLGSRRAAAPRDAHRAEDGSSATSGARSST